MFKTAKNSGTKQSNTYLAKIAALIGLISTVLNNCNFHADFDCSAMIPVKKPLNLRGL
jgi:hypothetical protein